MTMALKRKAQLDTSQDDESAKRRFVPSVGEAQNSSIPEIDAEDVRAQSNAIESEDADALVATESIATNSRAARFAALRERIQASRKENLKETKNEARRAAIDPSQLTSLNRKKDIAQHKLLKEDVEESGEDFERKRAWDWTIDESERWDERQAEKKRNRDNVAFQDFRKEAGKVYDRQIGAMQKNGLDERKEAYERHKQDAIDRSVQGGGLEIVETADGELIAVDKDGSFYSTGDSASLVDNKPSRAAVDRLVDDIRKAEEVRLKKRRERGRPDEGEQDVTYINEKNKQFNLKLARFYDKYTNSIRESFERGTAI